jgi:peptidoglycan/xylan/chitin deacetylase (PgdA/CDA1 family)
MAASLSRNRIASIERGRRDFPKVALTFDGGSGAGESELILEVLERRGVPATFFLTGDYIRQNPALVRRIAAAGHEVGNHTFSHPHLTAWNRTRRHDTLPGIDRSFIQEELNRTAREYKAATGRFMTALWRSPFGEVNDDLLRWAAETGWRHVGWTPGLGCRALRVQLPHVRTDRQPHPLLRCRRDGSQRRDRPDAPEHQPRGPRGDQAR